MGEKVVRDEGGFIKFFRKDLDMDDKDELREFLVKHPRYHTMNSWNKSTSYANCVKIHRLPLTTEQRSTAYDLLDVDEVWEGIRELTHDWEVEHKFKWQVGFNGRSSGYIVLYQGGQHPDGSTFTYPGKSFDMEPDMDFDGWELEDYRDRAEFVLEFDALCDMILTAFVGFIDNYEVKNETIMIPKTVKVLVEKGSTT
jgi:hypothetical protein